MAFRRREERVKIAVLGAGRVGSTIGRLWHAAGHDVTFTARHATRPRALAAELGDHVYAASVAAAEVVLVAVPGPAVPVSALEIRCMPITVRDCSGMARDDDP
jgi:8-hydroxy-5-deazaflavin:NADPH oxidoreductase